MTDVIRAANIRARSEVRTIWSLTEELVLTSFRRHLQSTVCRASALLAPLLAAEGLDLELIELALRPDRRWPFEALSTREFRSISAGLVCKAGKRFEAQRSTARHEDRTFDRVHRHAGVVIRRASHPAGRFGVRVEGRSVELCIGLHQCVLSTTAGAALLLLDRRLPETLALACLGRRIGEVVEHPLFRDSGWTIDRVVQPEDGVSPTSFGFQAGEVPHVMPWGSASHDRSVARGDG